MSAIVAVRDESMRARITAVHPLTGVRAGSALLALEGRLLAIQDDAYKAVWVDPQTLETEALVLRGSGVAQDKALKPDFEAAFVLAGRAWILGSGSRPNRSYITRLELASREAVLLNPLPLYGALGRAIGGLPNIEGAAVMSNLLRLFHRGPGRGAHASFSVDVPIDVLAMKPPRVLASQRYELGTVGGVNLAFTDVAHLDPVRLAYLAVAEDTPDGIADGPIAGAALGILEAGAARYTQIVEADGSPSRRKAEGLVLDPGGRSGWLLTDPDDAARPAELCRLELAMPR